MTSYAGRLAVALAATLAIICGCDEQDRTERTSAVPSGQESAIRQSPQPTTASDSSADAPPSVQPRQPAAADQAIERTFELPEVDAPDPSGAVGMPADCSIPVSECSDHANGIDCSMPDSLCSMTADGIEETANAIPPEESGEDQFGTLSDGSSTDSRGNSGGGSLTEDGSASTSSEPSNE